MKFSLVLITYNNEKHIIRGLESIQSQNISGWECILVDNGSTDNTLAIARDFTSGDARFRCFGKSNEGPSRGRNYGYQYISKETSYVAFIDGDDWLKDNFLDFMGGYLDAHPHIGMVTCQFEMADAGGNSLGLGFRSRYIPNFFTFPRQMKPHEVKTPFVTFFSVTGQGPFALFRRSIYDQTTGYEASFHSHEDSDIFCQMSLLSEVHCLPDALYVKRIHSSNLTRSGNTNPYAQSCYDKFRNKWDNIVFEDKKKQQEVIEARRYYYTRHAPLRHFKVLSYAIVDFLKKPAISKFPWMWKLFSSGISDTLFGYKKVKTQGVSLK